MNESKLTQYNYIISTLLNKYHIKYNYDEFSQLLSIRMWELLRDYNPNYHVPLISYLYTRLQFYLIDLFRSLKTFQPLESDLLELPNQSLSISPEQNLLYKSFLSSLTHKELNWLELKLAGYKQKELAKLLNCSISTLKTYQKNIKFKYLTYYTK
ncbi:LuxR C-terminal-related transcriptional regulator [Staphylococcus sp. ACRSN]|nr:LuxR C-terminal-related transcriptional regulator [Staphylococcus sp. ACRSN]